MKIRKIKKKSKILVKAKIIAEQVLNNFEEYQSLSIEDLRIRTDYLVQGLQENKFTLDDIVVDAFSIAREIIYREYKMLAYEVQMMGAYVVHCGDFAEMYTGEGKSLTILLVAFLNALEKKGVHIVTVNEYLVERDAKFAAQAFEKLGITVGYNTSKLSKPVKKEMFSRDITYSTNSELGFDYLKDNMVRSMEEKVIRQLHFVIIDEGDSVLIDEARTPLIISGQPKEDFSLYLDIDNYVSTLTKDDYVIDNESNTISLTDSGVIKAEKFFKIVNLYSIESAEIVHKITNALVAHFIFANGKEYLVKDDKIYLVDQFTGRVLEGRSYNAGLQQAIQAKERVKIEPENVVMATITYQSFFRLYDKLSAVSGTAMTEAEEFLKIYNMVVVRVPTNRPIIRIDKQDYIFGTKKAKWNHVVAEIESRHKTGQPILVGTASVSDSEIIHERLLQLGIPHEVLNARDNTKEAEIVKHGGQRGAITISTNMAGRGTDIKVPEEMKAIGGLYVIGTERHESRRIDNQLRGRTGRQGDPGESRFFTSLEDSLFKRFATDKFAKASEKLEDEYYDSKFFSRMLDNTQKKVEGLNFDIRKNLMDYDHVLSLQRELIYKQRDQILLKTNNFSIVNNMANDFASIFVEEFKNKENSALVDAKKIVNYLNEEVLKFPFFEEGIFLNQGIYTAVDKFLMIIKKVIEVKYKILEELSATNVIDEILLTNLDKMWTKHIDKMTKLREGVNLRSLEQRSPLNIYIEDGNNLFEKMKSEIVNSVITQLCQLSLPNEQEKLREQLEVLTASEEYKKKENEPKNKRVERTSNTAKEDEFMDGVEQKEPEHKQEEKENEQVAEENHKHEAIPEITEQIPQAYTSESFSREKFTTEEEFELEVQMASKELENTEHNENIGEVSDNDLEILLAKTEKYDLLNNKKDEEEVVDVDNVTDFVFKDVSSEWEEVENIVPSKDEDNKIEVIEKVEQKEALNEFEVQKAVSEQTIKHQPIIEIDNPTIVDEQTIISEQPMVFGEVGSESMVQEIIDESMIEKAQEEAAPSIEDDELERILNMPAFKDEDAKMSINEYIDKLFANLNLPAMGEEREEAAYIDDVEFHVNEIDTTMGQTPAQAKQEELNEFRKEIKGILAKSGIFTDEQFIRYRQGFFKNNNDDEVANKENTIDYSVYKERYKEFNKEEEDEIPIKEFYKTPYVVKRPKGTLFGGPISKYDMRNDAITIEEYIKHKEDIAVSEEQLNNLLYVDDEQRRLKRINKQIRIISKDELEQKKLEKLIRNEPQIIHEQYNKKLAAKNLEDLDDELFNNDMIIDLNEDKVEKKRYESIILKGIKSAKQHIDNKHQSRINRKINEFIDENYLEKKIYRKEKADQHESLILKEMREKELNDAKNRSKEIQNFDNDIIEYLKDKNVSKKEK